MNGVVLIFYTIMITGPANTQGPEISDRQFKTKQECAEFVNTVAQNNVVDEDYKFIFASIDGLVFKGGCYTPEEFEKEFYIIDPV